MVRNEDIQEEFDMFSEVWKFYKAALPVHGNVDIMYWEELERQALEVCNRHDTRLCKEFVMLILKKLDRKAKAYDSEAAKQG